MTKIKKQRNNSLVNLQKIFALMYGLGLSLDTIENVLTVIEHVVVADVKAARLVISDLAELLSGKMPRGKREPIVGSFVITALQMIADDLEDKSVEQIKKGA